MQDINKDILLKKYGIDLERGKYKIINKDGFYEIYRVYDSTEGCILGGQKYADGHLRNTGYTKYMVDLLNEHGGKAKLKIM